MPNPIDPYDWLALLEHWRFFVPLAVCVALGLGVYHLAGGTPDAAAVAAFIGLVGIVSGAAWELQRAARGL